MRNLKSADTPTANDIGLVGAGATASNASLPAAAASVPGADPTWSASVAAQIEREEYRVSPSDGGLQAPNRAHNLRTHFRAGGIEVSPRLPGEGDAAAPWQLTWRTKHWGRPSAPRDLTPQEVEPRLENDRVTYSYDGIDEWYENRKEGLEQGFTIHARPAGFGPLLVAGEFGGGLRPQLAAADGAPAQSPALHDRATAIDLLDENDARALRYGGLHVWDANGRDLPSHFALEGTEVAIVVEDAGATYPITIDPLMTSPAWTAESDQAGAVFGWSVATAGDVNGDGFSDVIVGAWGYSNGQSAEGRAYVYLGFANGPSLTPHWTAESNQAQALFGYSVAAAGDVNGDGFDDVIVGASRYDTGGVDGGRAYVYHGSASGLSPTANWTAESNQAGAEFATKVSTAGDVNGDGFADVIIGAPFFDGGQSNEGRVFVYHGSLSGLNPSPNWIVESDLVGVQFGAAVATAGDVNGDGFADVIIGGHLSKKLGRTLLSRRWWIP